ncbi:UDP-N-acetylmuramate:L-alanyl-gamma-D-glutamyl-meso-diaminopimelate ligase [bacterium]|nr:UDP-N-acetylmuramate:L-alanyl-gamma-D-glutamyl-meso-diaminopimelate ligase [bacterium]
MHKIYFIGICGSAMAQVAVMLKKLGHDVYGSDQKVYPPASLFLEREGIKILEEYKSENLDTKPDFVVIGNAVSRGNPEVEEVLNRKIRYKSLPEVIKEYFIIGKKSIVVTGTHGKSTTTGLVTHIFQSAGLNPGFILGGVLIDKNTGSEYGIGEHFIIEGDEYDTAFFDKASKFLHYMPDCIIINAVEFDHADIFDSIDDIIISFKRLINILPSKGILIINGHDKNAKYLSQFSFAPVYSFGFSKEFNLSADNCQFNHEGTSFDLYEDGKFLAKVKTRLLGNHNIQNTLAALSCAFKMNVPKDDAIDAVATFPGVKRRLELLSKSEDIRIYDDFAHHPTSIKVTLETLRLAYPDKRIIGIFEPRSNTMVTSIFQNTLPSSFSPADVVIISGIHRPEKVKEVAKFNPESLRSELEKKGKEAYSFKIPAEILNFLEDFVRKDDVLVFMSNGDFGGIIYKFVKKVLNEE